MRASDEATISGGVSGITLMHRAAAGIFKACDRWSKADSVIIITGSGNNGGDGFALALVLLENGISPVILPPYAIIIPTVYFRNVFSM